MRIPFTFHPSQAASFPHGLGHIRFERPRGVFSAGPSGSWDDYGVRDCCLLMDEDGYLSRDPEGSLIMYYSGGSSPDGMTQSVGRAVSKDEGQTWQREPAHPVIAPRPDCWDSLMATTPWAVRTNSGQVRLYYRGLTKFMEDEGCGLAVSEDGINFERRATPLFDRKLFAGMLQEGPLAIGVFNVFRMFDGRWMLSWESHATEYDGRVCIFAATSTDGVNFTPWRDGRPMFTQDDVTSCHARRVANPRITAFAETKTYLLTYNFCAELGTWATGFALSKDMLTFEDHPGNPMISPSFEPVDDPFSGRIEGGVIVKEDVEKSDSSPVRCFIMAIPQRGPGMCGAAIGLSLGYRKAVQGSFAFRHVSEHMDGVQAQLTDSGEDVLELNCRAGARYPTRASFMTPEVCADFKFAFRGESDELQFSIILSPEVSADPTAAAVEIRLMDRQVLVRRILEVPSPPPRIRYRILHFFGLMDLPQAKDDFRVIGPYEKGAWQDISIHLGGGIIVASADDNSIRLDASDISPQELHDISFVVSCGKVLFKAIECE